MEHAVRQRIVTWRPDPFLGIASDLFLGQRSLQRRNTLRIEIDVFGKLFLYRHETRYTRTNAVDGSALLELVSRVPGVAVDFAVDGAWGLVDHVHGGIFRAGIAAFVPAFRAQLATAVFGRVVDQPNLFHLGSDAVRNFFAQSLVECVLVKIVVGRLLVVAGCDLAFLGVARYLLLR